MKLLSTESFSHPAISLTGMCDILRTINPKADISPQALSQRINSDSAIKYLKEVLIFAIQKSVEPVWQKISPSLLAPFSRVLLEDSTVMSLHEKLADKFKGCGGSASKSALKVNLILDFTSQTIHDLSITPGNVPDQSRAIQTVDHLKKGDLCIRDLGYFSVKALVAIVTLQAYFLSRLLKGVGIYLFAEPNTPSIDIVDWLQKNFPHHSMVDLDIYLGQEKLLCRLIAYRVPDDVVNERIRKANTNARKKGRQLSDDHKKWLQFTFFITNVSREVWPPEVIGTIYRVRWQIELTFKSWKSLCQIHILKGQRPERIECLVTGRLIAIVLITILHSFVSWYCASELKREASLHKLIEWLRRNERLSKAVLLSQFDLLLAQLLQDLPKMICKQTRNRKTTLQLVESQIPYEESFCNETNRLAA